MKLSRQASFAFDTEHQVQCRPEKASAGVTDKHAGPTQYHPSKSDCRRVRETSLVGLTCAGFPGCMNSVAAAMLSRWLLTEAARRAPSVLSRPGDADELVRTKTNYFAPLLPSIHCFCPPRFAFLHSEGEGRDQRFFRSQIGKFVGSSSLRTWVGWRNCVAVPCLPHCWKGARRGYFRASILYLRDHTLAACAYFFLRDCPSRDFSSVTKYRS